MVEVKKEEGSCEDDGNSNSAGDAVDGIEGDDDDG